jgi:hypothetical protein
MFATPFLSKSIRRIEKTCYHFVFAPHGLVCLSSSTTTTAFLRNILARRQQRDCHSFEWQLVLSASPPRMESSSVEFIAVSRWPDSMLPGCALDRPLQVRQHEDAFQQQSYIIFRRHLDSLDPHSLLDRHASRCSFRLEAWIFSDVLSLARHQHHTRQTDKNVFFWHRLRIEANNRQMAAQSTGQATRKQ